MNVKRALFIAWIALAAWNARASGQQAPSARRATTPDPVLDQLVGEALGQNPDAAASAAEAEAARFRIVPAQTLPDPFLSFAYQNDGKSLSLGRRDMTSLGAMFSQPLPWPGKLALAGEIAGSQARRVQLGVVERTRLSIEARVRRAYYDLLLSRSLLDLIEERARAWRQIEGVVRERYAAGIAVQQDLLRAQTEILRLDEARADQLAASQARLAELNRAVGRPQGTPLEGRGLPVLPESLGDFADLAQFARDRSPEIAAAGEAITTAQDRVALARKDFLPDFVATAGPMYRGGLDPMWQVGLGITLPIYARSRQRNRLREAETQVRGRAATLSGVRQELDFRTRERYENLLAAIRVAKLYRDGVLAIDQLSLESALASYRTARVPFVTVLDALNTLYADRATYLSRIAESEKWRVAIDEADLAATSAMTGPSSASPAPVAAGSSGPAGGMNTMR